MGNNARDTPARREEEIAFLAVERVLGVRVALADAGGAPVPDGRWVADGRVSVVEVTSPPSGEVMRAIAEATREGRPFVEAGSHRRISADWPSTSLTCDADARS